MCRSGGKYYGPCGAAGFLEMSDRWSAHFYATPYEPEKFLKLRTQVDERFPMS